MILILTGTRPEIIKVAPVIRALEKEKLPFVFVHSGQHYSKEMDQLIIKDLKLKVPDFNLHVGSGTHAVQTGKIMEGIEEIYLKVKPKIVLVHGDTNTTLAGALVAKKMHIPVAHIEAGLRSYDYKMPEEVNRILVDRISDILFAPTWQAKKNLIKEGIDGKEIVVTGNTVVDALRQHLPFSKKSKILKKYNLKKNDYILLTAHRAENVDDKKKLKKLITFLEHVNKKTKRKIFCPLHPRTKLSLEKNKLNLPDCVIKTEAVGYLDMLNLLSSASLVLTDSGGVQEEAYVLKRPLMTLRDSTERPETLSANFIIHMDAKKFDHALLQYQSHHIKWNNEFGNGEAGQIIADTLELYSSL